MEHKLYVGNLAPTANEYHVIKLFQQYGKIVREQFIWHKHGPKRGEPKGFCFVEFATKQEAQTAKERANGRMFLGRPLVVRFVDEKVLYSNDRLSDDSAVVEAEKARKQENERDKEHKRISNEAKIKAIQAKLALMKKETPPASSDAGGKQPSSYSARNPSLRDRPY